MNDEYVRKDVHDVQIDALNNRIDDLKTEINEVRNALNRGWTIVGVIASIAAFAVTAIQFYMAVKGGR